MVSSEPEDPPAVSLGVVDVGVFVSSAEVSEVDSPEVGLGSFFCSMSETPEGEPPVVFFSSFSELEPDASLRLVGVESVSGWSAGAGDIGAGDPPLALPFSVLGGCTGACAPS